MDHKKKEIIEIGKLLWDKNLCSAASGNISLKLDSNTILITAHDACLGMLTEDEIIVLDIQGTTKPQRPVTTEKPIHLAIHKEFSQAAVIHAHPPFTNGYFAIRDSLECLTHESRLLLGEVPCLAQNTPSVTDLDAVVRALKNSNIVVLKQHGVIAIGETLRDAFFLIQLLENAVTVHAVAELYVKNKTPQHKGEATAVVGAIPTYEMFSDEHIKAIVDLVNHNKEFLEQAKAAALRTKLAITLDDTGKTFCFTFADGGISEITNSAREAEFIISGAAEYWRKIFNRQLDPFVATTQKKLKLQGDFGKISRWYAPFNKLFDVWKKVGVK